MDCKRCKYTELQEEINQLYEKYDKSDFEKIVSENPGPWEIKLYAGVYMYITTYEAKIGFLHGMRAAYRSLMR